MPVAPWPAADGESAGAVAGAGIHPISPATSTPAGLRAAVDALLHRAQQAGAVRADVDALAVQATVAGALAAVRHSARPSVGTMILDYLRP
ncbi:hypothetical protein AB0K16_42010 [Nonomuraea jabiensis]|uniref:SbtR family transcriptional regulator n=1 Tax=Nonomuraea jabiensis TaxID=882448 RepID=UPI00341624A9